MGLLVVVLGATLAGCGSAGVGELPPGAAPPPAPAVTVRPAGSVVPVGSGPGGILARTRGQRPATTLDDGRTVAVVATRARRLELFDAHTHAPRGSAPAGVGPTHVLCRERGPCYVTDTAGEALLVFSRRPGGLRLVRRLYLSGGPYGIAFDRRRRRLWVTLPGRNELVELPAHGRPHVLRRFATVRGPRSVAVDPRTGAIVVRGTSGVAEIVRP